MSAKFHKLKKSLGQNFLNNPDVITQIIKESQLNNADVVLEIGPGDGALTKFLIQVADKVFAFEIDEDLIENLQITFKSKNNFTLLNEDIRKINLPQFLINNNISEYKVVANLPYYITSFIIRFFLEAEQPPTEMIIMVQKEVAQRITAQIGQMSILAVAVQYYAQPEYLFEVKADNFKPVPKVNSAVIKISNIKKNRNKTVDQLFFRVVKSGFSAKRKTLKNNLANSLHLEKTLVAKKLTEIGLNENVRAQELSVADWKKLVELF
jgi:16S rRNA (adenine1518-N6/adenine1519-N6)-dimethyltransferase